MWSLLFVCVVVVCVILGREGQGVMADGRGAGYVRYDGIVEEVIKTPRPHTFLKASELP
jgi:hypothetical protein